MNWSLILTAAAVSSISGQAWAQTLQQQEMCAKQAKEYFEDQIRDGDYQSHYNTKLGKCLVLIHQTLSPGAGVGVQIIRQLSDAYERYIYADYFWMSVQGKKYWEVKPMVCELTPTLAEKRLCENDDEFKALISPFMTE
jgi:hypothetical protein